MKFNKLIKNIKLIQIVLLNQICSKIENKIFYI